MEYIISTGIPTIAVIIVGFILRQQIKSQQAIISNMKAYADIFDPVKIREFTELYKELNEKSIKTKVEIEVHNFFKEQYAIIGERFDELASLASSLMDNFTKEERVKFIKDNLPHCEEMFGKYFNDRDNRAGGFFRNL